MDAPTSGRLYSIIPSGWNVLPQDILSSFSHFFQHPLLGDVFSDTLSKIATLATTSFYPSPSRLFLFSTI